MRTLQVRRFDSTALFGRLVQLFCGERPKAAIDDWDHRRSAASPNRTFAAGAKS